MNDTPETRPATRQVSIAEAMAILGLSRRTIERRLTGGRLRGVKADGRWLVDVPMAGDRPATDPPPDATARLADVENRHADVVRQLSEVTAERDRLTTRVDVLVTQLQAVTEDRDYLRQVHAMTLARTQKLLPETAESVTGRTWWQFWKGRADD